MARHNYRLSADEARENSNDIIRRMRAHKLRHAGMTEPEYRAYKRLATDTAMLWGVVALLLVAIFVGLRLWPQFSVWGIR